MMIAERSEYLRESSGNKGNGYRPGHTYGHGRRLEFRIPRDRYGNFHPQILAILRDQEEECDRLAGVLYTKGLTQEQVGDVFDEIYGEHYSKSSISRMVDSIRTQVSSWLERGLESYYPVVFVDCVHIKIHRKRCVTHLKRNMFAKVRHGDKAALAADMRDVFRTGQRDYTVEEAWDKWQEMCDKWGKDYRSIKLLRNNADYKAYLTYLNYAPEIQSMIYTTNWIERLNRDFRRVTRMRTAMPNEDSVITLMGSVAIDHKAFDRKLPGITCDKQLFPD